VSEAQVISFGRGKSYDMQVHTELSTLECSHLSVNCSRSR